MDFDTANRIAENTLGIATVWAERTGERFLRRLAWIAFASNATRGHGGFTHGACNEAEAMLRDYDERFKEGE